jgi:hypothetical protein
MVNFLDIVFRSYLSLFHYDTKIELKYKIEIKIK